MNPIILVFSLNCNKKPITQINSQIRIVKSLAEPSPIPLMPYPKFTRNDNEEPHNHIYDYIHRFVQYAPPYNEIPSLLLT